MNFIEKTYGCHAQKTPASVPSIEFPIELLLAMLKPLLSASPETLTQTANAVNGRELLLWTATDDVGRRISLTFDLPFHPKPISN